MPKIVKTITNKGPSGSKAWILESEYSDYFTQTEIDDILTPYTSFMSTLTGSMGYTVEELGNTLVVKQEFDTEDNMKAALNIIGGDGIHTIVKNRNDLIKNKLTGLGSSSSFQITFE